MLIYCSTMGLAYTTKVSFDQLGARLGNCRMSGQQSLWLDDTTVLLCP
jgi:hypothetical protein